MDGLVINDVLRIAVQVNPHTRGWIDTQSHLDKFAVLNSPMDTAVAVDLLLSVFDYERCEALSRALVAEIKRRRALETKQKDRVKAVRGKVAKL